MQLSVLIQSKAKQLAISEAIHLDKWQIEEKAPSYHIKGSMSRSVS